MPQAGAAVLPVGPRPGAAEASARQPELQQAQRHADRRGQEADAPAVAQRQPARDQRADEGTEVDAHVEDGEPGVAPRAAFRVQLGHQRRDVRLQQPDAQDDDRQSREKQLRRARQGQHQVAEGHQRAACQHRALGADQPVRDPAAGQRGHEHGGRVQAVDGGRGLVVQSVAAVGHGVDQEQHEQRAHAVEREALPHLREEERGERRRVAEEAAAGLSHWIASRPLRPGRQPAAA